MHISPLERLVQPDYRDQFIDLLFNGHPKKHYLVLCAKCNQWIGANHFKQHLKSFHEFDWWDSEGQHLDELKSYVVHVRVAAQLEAA